MANTLDSFLTECRTQSDQVMGTTTVVLSGGTELSGVWSPVMTSAELESGGEQLMATVVVTVATADGINDSLIGETTTYDGTRVRVVNVERDGVDTHVSFVDETETLREL